jgi:hypothetical protein
MAKVNMDLAELKQLENKIEKLEKDKQDLIDKQHQVVIYHKYFTGRIKPIKIPKHNSIHLVDSINISGQKIYTSYDGKSNLAYFNSEISLQQALDCGLVEIEINEDFSKHTKDYKNMSDVISDIKKEAEDNVKELLQKTLNRATTAEYKISIIEDQNKKEILKINDYYDTKIKELILKNQSNIEILEKEYKKELLEKDQELINLRREFDNYKENKKQISLEEQLKSLKLELSNYKNKSLLKRIFNI